jgi:hypothetical protein
MMHVCENSILRDKLALERAEVDDLRSELAKLRALMCPKCGCEYGEAS